MGKIDQALLYTRALRITQHTLLPALANKHPQEDAPEVRAHKEPQTSHAYAVTKYGPLGEPRQERVTKESARTRLLESPHPKAAQDNQEDYQQRRRKERRRQLRTRKIKRVSSTSTARTSSPRRRMCESDTHSSTQTHTKRHSDTNRHSDTQQTSKDNPLSKDTAKSQHLTLYHAKYPFPPACLRPPTDATRGPNQDKTKSPRQPAKMLQHKEHPQCNQTTTSSIYSSH